MHWQYVVPGYLIVFGTLAVYTWWVLRRGRELTRQVPEGKRRYLDPESS